MGVWWGVLLRLFLFSPFALLPVRERGSALATEGKRGGIGKATLWAAAAKWGGTLTAKSHLLGILKPTLRAQHYQYFSRLRRAFLQTLESTEQT